MGPTCKLFRYFKVLKVKRTLLTKAYTANAGGSQQAKVPCLLSLLAKPCNHPSSQTGQVAGIDLKPSCPASAT